MARIGYARVSAKHQDLEAQLEQLEGNGCKRIFYGKQSGISLKNEEKLKEMIDYIREGDVVVVVKLDRLGRSLKSILATIDLIHYKNATFQSLDGAIDTSKQSPFSKAIISLLGAFSQLERELIAERTSEGRSRAIAEGKAVGRKKQISLSDREKIRKLFLKGCSKSQLSKQYKVSRTTILRIIEEGQNK
jgi:DNA invertase Pin-like site-specific DNA recombinase